jgi:hypothetical protein
MFNNVFLIILITFGTDLVFISLHERKQRQKVGATV